jgi:uncharacterized protein YndB with AHSA1/START domain
MEEELYPIIIQVTIPLPTHMIFSAMTEPAGLTGWLCAEAQVDKRVGGECRLRFEGESPFETHGKVTHFTPDVDFGFEWRAPPAFAPLMNEPVPVTRVYFRLADSPEGIDVTLEHIGWGSGEEWEAARSWHFHLWDEKMQQLKAYLIKTAYG